MTINGRLLFWGLLLAATILLVTLLSPILMPFFAGALIAYLSDPLADRLEAAKLSRTAAVTVVFLAGFGVLLLFFLVLLPLLETQVRRFLVILPQYVEWAMGLLMPFLQENLAIDPSVLEADQFKTWVASHLKETGGLIRGTLKTLSTSSLAVLQWMANVVMIPVIAFYLLRDWDRLVAYVDDLLPRDVQPVIALLARESDEMLGAFLRGQVMVMMALSLIYTVGLWWVGLEFALLIGLIAGLVSFVPYLGLIVGVAIAGIAVMFQTQDVFQLFWVLLVFGLAQLIEGTLLTPLLVGERIGLHPVAVLFSVLAGGQLFGFLGVLLALPVAAVLAVILRHLHDSYKQSQIYRISVDS